MTISGYARGHIVATGPQHTAGTSAPLILTHDPLSGIQSLNGATARLAISNHFVNLSLLP